MTFWLLFVQVYNFVSNFGELKLLYIAQQAYEQVLFFANMDYLDQMWSVVNILE